MAEFIAFNPNVKAKGQHILGFVNFMRKGRKKRLEILKKHGIEPRVDGWYPIQAWLDALKGLSQEIGDLNLFLVGKSIIESADFPPMKGLYEALTSINIAYHMNHQLDGELMFNLKTGDMLEGIGHYKVVSFDYTSRAAVMECKNPFPTKLDEGLLYKMVEKFKPEDSTFHEVKVDSTKEQRPQGADSCTYLISW